MPLQVSASACLECGRQKRRDQCGRRARRTVLHALFELCGSVGFMYFSSEQVVIFVIPSSLEGGQVDTQKPGWASP